MKLRKNTFDYTQFYFFGWGGGERGSSSERYPEAPAAERRISYAVSRRSSSEIPTIRKKIHKHYFLILIKFSTGRYF